MSDKTIARLGFAIMFLIALILIIRSDYVCWQTDGRMPCAAKGEK
jgi:hypothetical protein